MHRTLKNNTSAKPSNTAHIKIIAISCLKFLALSVIILIAPLAVYIDTNILGTGIREASVTEYSQETLLAISSLIFFALAYFNKSLRGFAILVGGFFGTMLIREMDQVLDAVFHGFWVYPAVLWAGLIIAIAMRFRHDLLATMATAARSHSFVYIVLGLAIVLAFSRVFGTTSLWLAVLDGSNAAKVVKNTVQEGLELLGYLLIFVGSIGYMREQGRQQATTDLASTLPSAANAPEIDLGHILQDVARKHNVELSPALENSLIKQLESIAFTSTHSTEAKKAQKHAISS